MPYLDLNIRILRLGCLRVETDTSDQITIESANAIKKCGVGIKCATITPDESKG